MQAPQINFSNRIIARVIIGCKIWKLINNRINGWESSNCRIVPPFAIIIPIQSQILIQFLPIVLVPIVRNLGRPNSFHQHPKGIVVQFLQESDRSAVGPEIYPGIAQMVFDRVFIIERGSSIGGTTTFAVINCLQIGAEVFNP